MHLHLQTFERLRPLSVTCSRRTVLRLLQRMGKDHDLKPLQWKRAFEADLAKRVQEVKILHTFLYTYSM